MMNQFKFELPLPPTTNHAYGSRYSEKHKRTFIYMTAEAKKWIEDSKWEMHKHAPKELIIGDVKVELKYFLKYDRDIDNQKLILDSMEGMFYANDKQVVELRVSKEKRKTNPSVKICLYASGQQLRLVN